MSDRGALRGFGLCGPWVFRENDNLHSWRFDPETVDHVFQVAASFGSRRAGRAPVCDDYKERFRPMSGLRFVGGGASSVKVDWTSTAICPDDPTHESSAASDQ